MKKKIRCRYCRSRFHPDPRCKNPIACSNPKCQRKRKYVSHKRWCDRNPDVKADRHAVSRAWFAMRPGFWQDYRRKHPEQAECNRRKQRERRKRRRVAKSIPKSAYHVDKQKEIFQLVPVGESVAKSIPILVQRIELEGKNAHLPPRCKINLHIHSP